MRNKLGQFVIGHKAIGGFRKGSKHTKKAKEKVSISLQGKFGDKSRRWMGEKAGYAAKHMWVKKYLDMPNYCEFCRRPRRSVSRLEWANISGKYKRIRDDWLCLCPPCHRIFDGKIHCKHGHEYTIENTYINNRGHRECKTCQQKNRRRRNATVNKI